ncbi:hypothetical protein SanaruYs_34800 [Chryseotalea sanaruensis]|uniref:Uncharacterized protein n=1 Tax=Chryseotalea sanaruensis TaxID=2482724 RepID=A0A401UEE5_9BACT|nr:UPF0489 family protein [Chryseotalea sanaruensis]GCC53237.1 hypothetical protein SanaruYs_34800 [Chryseotalea sanaruensis]
MSINIPIYIVEEHHEAFYVWHYAIKHKLINRTDNTLIHIDEHSDMASPNLDTAIRTVNTDLKRISDFVYRELNIASFIIPSIYQKIFNKVYWIRQKHNKTNQRSINLYVRSFKRNGKKLSSGRMSLLLKSNSERSSVEDDAIKYRFYKQHIYQLGKLGNVVLDIDLDYFSCIQDPLKKEFQIEITEKEYHRFLSSQYHRIRFFDFGKVQVERKGGRFYFILNRMKQNYKSHLKVKRNIIIARLDETIAKIREQKIRPSIITICRSRFSGYTPDDQWEFIEKELLKRLNGLFVKVDIKHISEIIK